MPLTGDSNTKFGVYKSACCGEEIVIPEGATFPSCAKHITDFTDWQSVSGEIIKLSVDTHDSAA
jgi:hypothetical protein